MSANSRYKLSMLLDLLHKQFGLQPEFCINYWHVPDPSAYWQLIACGKCGKEVSDAKLKLVVLEDALKQAGVKWRYDNGGATCNVKLPNYQLGLGYVPVPDTVAYSVTIIEGEASKPKVTQINNMPVPAGVKINYHPSTQHVDLALRDLQRLLRDATLPTSPAKVD